MVVLSSAAVGGGFTATRWLINVGVPLTYCRTDLAEHCHEISQSLNLEGDGLGLFTAAKVADHERRSAGGVTVDATVGISKPTWAADATGGWTQWQPGTVNIVVQLPGPVEPAAAVNAVMTATEAKTQAFLEAGIPGTGTASDAIVIAWPAESGAAAEQFAGPRSAIGSQIANAVHATIEAGIATWQERAREQITRDQIALETQSTDGEQRDR